MLHSHERGGEEDGEQCWSSPPRSTLPLLRLARVLCHLLLHLVRLERHLIPQDSRLVALLLGITLAAAGDHNRSPRGPHGGQTGGGNTTARRSGCGGIGWPRTPGRTKKSQTHPIVPRDMLKHIPTREQVGDENHRFLH